MGNIKDKDREKELDNDIQKSKEKDKKVTKILLLGAGESGKSTFFKQMIQRYGAGYSDDIRESYTPNIRSSTIDSMQTMIETAGLWGIKLTEADSAEKLKSYDMHDPFTPEIADYIDKMWRDPGIQEVWAKRNKMVINDEIHWFFQKETLDRMHKPDYLPTFEDVLRVRVRTTGLIETSFDVDGSTFKLVDVGGQRNERKKWIHHFEGVKGVVYMAALSGYDQILFEDLKQNRIMEGLKLFEEIVNSEWFTKSHVFLLLNKKDLFEEKLKTNQKGFQETFPDYHGDFSFDHAAEFIKQKFLERNHSTKEIQVDFLTALDPNSCISVMSRHNATHFLQYIKSLEAVPMPSQYTE